MQSLSPSGQSEEWTADDFWKMAFNPEHPKNTEDLGYLVSQFDFEEDWDSEIHPNGDELIYCVAGDITFILELEGGNKEVRLGQGEFLMVPQNTWHTANVLKPTKALFVTWGFGTKHRNR